MRSRRTRSALGTLVALLLLPLAAAAADQTRSSGEKTAAADGEKTHTLIFLVGGQIGFNDTYASFLKLGAGYNLHLKDRLFLDFAAAALLCRDTNFLLDGGVRWKFGQPAGWRGFLHLDLEFGLLTVPTREAIAGRVGGGVGYYSTPSWGFTLGGSFAMGPVFGDGNVRFGVTVDVLLGVEVLF